MGRSMKVVQMPRILRRTLLELLRGLLRMLVFLSLAYLVLELFSPGYQSEFHPFYRFFLFIRDIATFRLGENADGVPLAFFMSRGITRSLLVFVPSIFAASLISYALVRRDCISNPSRLHRILHGANGVTSAIPVYWLALLFFLLSTRISWLPLGGVTDVNHSDLTAPGKLLDYARHLILPWASLFTFSTFAITGALERRMDGIMGSRFVLLARTQGYSGRRLFRTHLRPSLISELFLQLSAQMPVFITILIFTELVFRYTGLGYYLLYPYKFSWGGIDGIAESQAALVYLGIIAVLFQVAASTAAAWLSPFHAGDEREGGEMRERSSTPRSSSGRFAIPLAWIGGTLLCVGLYSLLGGTGQTWPADAVSPHQMDSMTSIMSGYRWLGFLPAVLLAGLVIYELFTSKLVSFRGFQRVNNRLNRGGERRQDRNYLLIFALALPLVLIIGAWLIPRDPVRIPRFISSNPRGVPIGEAMAYYLQQALVAGRFALVPLSSALAGLLAAVTLSVLIVMYRMSFIRRLIYQLELFPSILLLLMLLMLIPGGLLPLWLSIALICMVRAFRGIHGRLLEIRDDDYIRYSRSIGSSPTEIIRRHVIPVLWPELRRQIPAVCADALLLEANFVYLDRIYRISEGSPAFLEAMPIQGWGSLLSDATRLFIRGYYLPVLFPALFMLAAVLGFRFAERRLSR
jgi:ABC-type dipeptide/oligopeptide/nickel transport system permease component